MPSREEIWRQCLDQQFAAQEQFVLCLWGAQRLCYVSLYFSYEDFRRKTVNVACGEEPEPPPRDDRELCTDARRRFGNCLVAECFEAKQLKIARKVRNALVHHGGRVPQEVNNATYGIPVKKNVLQVRAPDVTGLFNDLKGRARTLLRAALEPDQRSGGE
jgi:hypothetical protein